MAVWCEVDVVGVNIFEADGGDVPHLMVRRINDVDEASCSTVDARACPPYQEVGIVASLHTESESVLIILRPLVDDRERSGV